MNSKILLIIPLLLMSACGNEETATEEKTASAKKSVPVNIEEVQPESFKHFVTVQGAVESDKTILISPRTSATVTSIKVSAGDRVNKGDVLAELDGDVIEKQLDEVQTGLELARDLFNRQKNLRDQNIGSEVEYLQAKNRVESLEKQLATLNEQYSFYSIKATIDGTVDRVMLKQGETVNPGVPVFQIANSEALKVTAEISEAYISTIDKSDSVEITFPSQNITLHRTIDVVSRVINASNRTFTIEIFIPDMDGKILPNMVAKLKINDVTENETISISPNLIQENGAGYFLYVARQQGSDWIASKRTVEPGTSYDNAIIIKNGINPGEFTITKGHTDVSDGTPLSIVNR